LRQSKQRFLPKSGQKVVIFERFLSILVKNEQEFTVFCQKEVSFFRGYAVFNRLDSLPVTRHP
ncbi:MAG: hypothetical protein KAI59_03625, partial [Planctomycetes bacterium]|nr:hypothetical protein [Planctomycetota bacterium]MCK5473096.1 hypothetical protein [Planctomycetota bacterium]